jgi:hypothetical protein
LSWISTCWSGRVRRLLLEPKSEWLVIAQEPATVGDLYKIKDLKSVLAELDLAGLERLKDEGVKKN